MRCRIPRTEETISTIGAITPEQLPPDIVRLVEIALRRGATDILLSTDRAPSIRFSGVLTAVEELAPPPTAESITALTRMLLGERGLAGLERHRDHDFGFQIAGLSRFRGAFYYHRGGLALALRLLPAEIPRIEDLGLPPIVGRLALLPRGLILVTGPTGSGKTTTLAAMIHRINETSAKHIVTIEDPVEYAHADKLSRIEQRELGPDTPSFVRGLRSILRQNPDIVLVGEMRDPETMQAALSIAETGHLTLSTLHTNSCASTIHRIVDAFPEDRQRQILAQLGLTLEAVITQLLVPRIGGGLTLATEVMIGTPAVRAMIREGRAHQLYSGIQAGQQFGMRTMNQSLAALVSQRLVDFDVAIARSPDVKELRQLLSRPS